METRNGKGAQTSISRHAPRYDQHRKQAHRNFQCAEIARSAFVQKRGLLERVPSHCHVFRAVKCKVILARTPNATAYTALQARICRAQSSVGKALCIFLAGHSAAVVAGRPAQFGVVMPRKFLDAQNSLPHATRRNGQAFAALD